MALFVPTVRAVRANPFARRQRSNLENFLKSAPLCQWPDQLKAAWKILHVELGLTKAQARDVVAHSAAAAVDCAVALADRSRMISQAHAQTSVHSACETISNCIKRAPAPLRNRLDQVIVPLIESPVIDTEIIQSTLETASNIFGQFPDIEPSRAARRLIEPFNPAQDDWEDRHIERFGAVSDYEGLGAEVRDRAERALSRLRQQRQNEVVVTAADIFSALAAAIGEDTSGRLNVKSNQLIKDYTFDLAVIWRAVGLSRASAKTPRTTIQRQVPSVRRPRSAGGE